MMLIPPKYFLTPKITRFLSDINANREILETISIPSEIEINIRRRSTLKSSLFSARIEGNSATLDNFSKLGTKDKKKIEINNLLRAINWIYERNITEVREKDLLNLHLMTMKGLESEAGKFRDKHEGIFTSGGVVVYHAPPPSQIKNLMTRLLKYINSDKEEFAPIKAILAHYTFEKIHPFTDGSGRVGRLLILIVLKKFGFGFKGILPFEEGIDLRREIYYRMLEESERDVTNYLEFMLETIKDASDEAKRDIFSKNSFSKEDSLLPRRAEIVKIVKEHKLVNFDMLRRRFREINERTLRYDLHELQNKGFIKKLGTTRGVYYKIAVI